MKYLITTIAALLLVGCVSNMSIYEAAKKGNIKAFKQHLAAGTDVNAKDNRSCGHLCFKRWLTVTKKLSNC